jgi:hypothetical protein
MWNSAWRYSIVAKERRLGRGLEALLGQLPARNETAAPAQHVEPATVAAKDQISAPAAPAGPSAESLFWLDGPHAAPGQLAAQPHRPPVQATASVAAGSAAVSAASGGQDARAPGRVNVRQIDSNPAQPRQDFDPKDMQSLAESISTVAAGGGPPGA